MSGTDPQSAAGSQMFAETLQASEPTGPFFVDTAACRCSLQEEISGEAWRCVGNGTEDVYSGQAGKWFWALENNTSSLRDPVYSDSNPPNTTTAYINLNGQFVPFSANTMSNGDSTTGPNIVPVDDRTATSNISNFAQDQECTGNNDTQASMQFYQGLRAVNSEEYLPCWMPGTVPVLIQNSTSWKSSGCNLGFWCERYRSRLVDSNRADTRIMTGANNTETLLPTYCPPFPQAQIARLAGAATPPMGPYEPAICAQGSYCPSPGNRQILCPAGSYCPRGAYQPLKCSFSALCPAGSSVDRPVFPLVALVLLDLWIVLATVATNFIRQRHRSNSKKRHKAKRLGYGLPFSTRHTRSRHYHDLSESNSNENVHLESRISGVRRANTGFLAAMDNDYSFEEEDGGLILDEKLDTDIHQFVQSLSRSTVATSFGLSFGFENLVYQPKRSKKPILSGISGEIKRGTLVGVMGASGAGKSTFINVLMGSQTHTGGIMRVNGSPGTIAKYKKIIGYVPQDDIVLPELTVRESILHSARIRLPADWEENHIQTHVDILLRCLNLFHVRDSLVGDTGASVISGGERKRVSIGIELAAAPMALFLDEPTSGLDSTSASSIVTTLKALSRLGITVVTIIHQPRHEIFDSLDSLLLLGAGRLLYFGQQTDVQEYFEQCGFNFPKEGNMADQIMDIIGGQGKLYKRSGQTSISSLTEQWSYRQANLRPVQPMVGPSPLELAALRKTVIMRGAPWYRQIYFCLHRSLLQQYRRRSSVYFEVGVAALAGLLLGLAQVSAKGNDFRGIYLHPYELLSSSTDFASIPELSLLVALSIGLTASSPGVKIFGEEKLIYLREASSGHNRFAYYVGKVLSTLPRMFLANLHFTVFFILLATPKISWSASCIANFLYFYCIYGLASCVSMITRREDGPLIATMSSLVAGIISGVSPTLRVATSWHMQWLWRMSPGTWLAEGYFTQNVKPYAYLYQIDMAAKSTGYTLDQFGLDLVMLFALGSLYRVLAFVGLRVFNRRRGR